MELQGKIKMIGETQEFGTNGFRKRDIVITTEEQYPQHLLIEFVQDKTDLLNDYQVGQFVKIAINMRGREWVNPQGETKYFNSIQGWKIKGTGQEQQHQPPVQQQDTFEPNDDLEPEEHDDLPF